MGNIACSSNGDVENNTSERELKRIIGLQAMVGIREDKKGK